MKVFEKIYLTLLILATLSYFVFLGYQNLVTSGRYYSVKDFCSSDNFISDLYPASRAGGAEIDDRGRCFNRLLSEPDYFSVQIPRTFESGEIKIYYKNQGQNLLQLGVMRNKTVATDWNFTLYPVENKIFDYLNWARISEGDTSLWQKQPFYHSIKEFLANPPINKRIATYHYDFPIPLSPKPLKLVPWNPKTPLNYIDYIISDYRPPVIEGDLKMATIKFDLTPESINNHSVEFMISAPDFNSGQSEIKIYNLEIVLERAQTKPDEVWPLIKDYLLRKFRTLWP
ncbi:MAG: hypothetical protein AAB465_02765 [Patescibacteria group bacterium]